MARNDFAIEPPRKIKISLPGFEPKAAAEATPPRKDKKRKRRQRKQRAAGSAAVTSSGSSSQPHRSANRATPAGAKEHKHRRNDEAEIEALAAAAAATAIPREVQDQLLRAFAGTQPPEQGGQHADE